jgi:exosome complex exonuclease DIS3/RRP44
MAQMAGRASVEYFVGLAIKGKIEGAEKTGEGKVKHIVEEAYVIRTFRNGLAVFVSK